MTMMGHSFPCLSFYVSIVERKWSEEKVYNMKSLVKYGLCKEGAVVMASLMFSKASFSTYAHLNWTSLFIIHWTRLTISEKYGTNPLTKLIFPKKDCMKILLCGGGIYIIDLVIYGSMKIPSLEITCPKKMPSKTTKMVFFGFKEILCFLAFFEYLLQMFGVISPLFWINGDIIKIDHHAMTN